MQLHGLKKVLCRLKRKSVVTQKSHEPFQGDAHALSVIDDGNNWELFLTGQIRKT